MCYRITLALCLACSTLGVTMSGQTNDVATYCKVAIALHAVLDDPRFDLALDDIGTDKAAKDFAKVWLQFDEQLRLHAPNPEIASALKVIAAHARSVVGAAAGRPDNMTYVKSLELVMQFHTSHCLPDDGDDQM